MDCVYSSWVTRNAEGFSGEHVAALQRLAPFLALAVKSVALTRMTGTLMRTYLGRDAGRRVLSGRIVRGVADASTRFCGSATCAGSRGSPM
jgi:adenylate cyclase